MLISNSPAWPPPSMLCDPNLEDVMVEASFISFPPPTPQTKEMPNLKLHIIPTLTNTGAVLGILKHPRLIV